MTVKEIRISVSRALTDELVMEELNGWPPSLPEFISLGSEKVDFDAAFQRCVSKEPQGRAEQWVYENSAFNIRRLSQTDAERFHKKELKKAIEMEKSGKLVLNSEMALALPPNSVKNVNDIEREKYEEKTGGKIHPRIQAILDSKKKG